MPRTVTTVSVHPDRAEKLRRIRDEEELPNLDAALGEILNQRGE
jgi:2-polyprenyl-6-methoxyphenol hydroxylase-like FAD-dependent oxidoreductase